MGSKVVVTYKRKRLFSRSDHSHPIILHSDDKPSESKSSANFDNHEESIIAQHALQNKDTEFETCHECPKDQVGENMPQSENCDCGQFSNQTQKSTLTWSKESHLKQITFNPNDVPLEERCQIGSAGQSNSLFVKSDSEYGGDKGKEDTCKCNETNSISPTCDAFSGTESDVLSLIACDGINCSRQMKDTSLEERDKLDKDQCSSLSNNNNNNNNLDTTKRKLTSTLITFCRRSKRNKDNAAANDIASDKCASVTPLAASCSVDTKKNEKKPTGDNDNSCSFSAPAAAMVVMHMDNPLHSPHGTAKTDPTTFAQNSHEEISSLGEKVCMGVQDLSNEEDVNSRSMPSNISGTRGSLSSLDLSISPPASRDIDCNIPLDCDSDENHLPGPLEVVHDSLGSTSEVNKNTSTLQVPCAGNGSPVSDKGKFIVESSPVKNNCIQLFPENRSNDTLQLANDPGKSPRFIPPSLQSSRIHNGRAYYSSLYDWPQLQPREPFQDFLPSTSNRADSLSRHLMMLDNILTRARGKFEFPTTWSEEELDCLWIGVRRHGVNNWDAILRDPRLHFSPWKTTRDLADRWRDEQYRLFRGTTPVSQVKYTVGRPDLLSGHTTGVQLSLGVQQNPLHECGARNSPPIVHYMDLARNRQFQKPVNYLSRSSWGLINPSEGSGFGKGNLPHWLREAVEIPPRPSGPSQNVVSSVCNPNLDCFGNSQQLWVNTKNAPVQRRTEQCAKASGKSELHERQGNNNNNNKQDNLIIINSDVSSEETISDDHSIRP